jgi:hypothetical protein
MLMNVSIHYKIGDILGVAYRYIHVKFRGSETQIGLSYVFRMPSHKLALQSHHYTVSS